MQWDIGLVLSFVQSERFKEWIQLSDKNITLKPVYLLALTTGQHRSELHAPTANVKWIQGKKRVVQISPSEDFISKSPLVTKGLGALKPIVLGSLDSSLSPEAEDDNLLCPVKCLSYYMSRMRSCNIDPANKGGCSFLISGVMTKTCPRHQSPGI